MSIYPPRGLIRFRDCRQAQIDGGGGKIVGLRAVLLHERLRENGPRVFAAHH